LLFKRKKISPLKSKAKLEEQINNLKCELELIEKECKIEKDKINELMRIDNKQVILEAKNRYELYIEKSTKLSNQLKLLEQTLEKLQLAIKMS